MMEISGLKCQFHMPAALKDNGKAQGLPPYAPQEAFLVDDYKCPAAWMHGSARASSYWLPVEEDRGMWLDFNLNHNHSHHVAVVLSIQGINPITGQQTKALRLEQYVHNCLVHKVPFQQDRFCPECDFKWDAQNYLATTGTPNGLFWIDGFRDEDGVIRQYVFTRDICKGVAKQLIGDDRVFAVGIAFYLSKAPKPPAPIIKEEPAKEEYHHHYHDYHHYDWFFGPGPIHRVYPKYIYYDNIYRPQETWTMSAGPSFSTGSQCHAGKEGTAIVGAVQLADAVPQSASSEQKMLEVSAGAQIKQRIYADPEELDFWCDKPHGLIYINYCDHQTAEKIKSSGKKKRAGSFLAKLNR